MTNKKNGSGYSDMNVIEQLDLLKSILENSTEYSIIATDLNCSILIWNRGAQRLYGYTAAETIGKNTSILHHPTDLTSGRLATIFNEVRQQQAWSGEIEYLRKDNSRFTALVTIMLRKDANNKPIGYTFISRDISELQNALSFLNKLKTSEEILRVQNTELEKTTQEAQQSNRLKSEFLANVSHELRTPLNGIIGFAELLYDDVVDPESPKYKKFLEYIILSANQLLMLINDVLDLAKIEADKMDFHPEKIDLAKIFAEVKDTFQAIIAEKNIQFVMRIDPLLQEIVIDTERLTQIFYNYVSNALKFTPVGGEVSVCVCPEKNNQFRLEVKDSGIGIHEDDLSKLFGKFHQLDSGPSKRFTGTGLGLALTKRIVEAQGGKVGVNSTYQKGSIFYAILPCHPPHRTLVADLTEGVHEEHTEKTPTILVVEHASHERKLIVDALKREGYAVVTAENVVKATEHHHEPRFDAIILDLFQPDMTKWEIIRTLRSKMPREEAPPIVVKIMVEQPVSLGFRIHDFLIKPVNVEELLSALNWVGANAEHNKIILVIDSDPKALAFANQALSEHGFQVICATNKVSALLELEKSQPDAVLLDPFISGTDGLEFLRSYRQTERGLYTPLIIWTATKLTREEHTRFKNSIQRIMLTREDLKKGILADLEQHLPRIKAY